MNGIRAPDGSPIALGYHTGHWEVGLLMEEAARTFSGAGAVPFAAYVSDPCDGRTNGTAGMLDSLAYRNDAAIVLRRLIRSLPTRRGVLGIATCDKGLPAMMMALAGTKHLPAVLVPGAGEVPAGAAALIIDSGCQYYAAGGATAFTNGITAAGSGNINDTVNLPSGGSVTYTVSATISGAAGTVMASPQRRSTGRSTTSSPM